MKLYNGENSMLLPTPDPIITIIRCEDCDGSGENCEIEEIEDDGYENKITIKTCPECMGTGTREVWR